MKIHCMSCLWKLNLGSLLDDPALPQVRGIFVESRRDRTVHATPPTVQGGQGWWRRSQSPLSPEDDGTKREFCLQPGKPSWLESKTDASDLGGKVKRLIFGKAEGTFAWGNIRWEVLVAILMKQVRRGIWNSAACSIRTRGWGSMEKTCDVSLVLYWPGAPPSLLLGFNCFCYISFVTGFQKSRGCLCRDGPTHKQFQSSACAWFSVHHKYLYWRNGMFWNCSFSL